MSMSPVRLASVTLFSLTLIGLSLLGVQSTQAQAGDSPPVAVQDTFNLAEDTILQVPAASGLLINDINPENGALQALRAPSGPSNGSLSLQPDGSFTYIPNQDYSGPDSFEYYAYDGQEQSQAGEVDLQIASVQDAPTAAPLTVDVPEDTPTTITLQGSDPDGDPLTYHVDPQPAHGILTGTTGSPAWVYTPARNYSGNDSFQYYVKDAISQSITATVTINILPQPDNPTNITLDKNSVAENQPAGTKVGELSSTSPDYPEGGGSFTYTLVDSENYPDNGLFAIASGNRLVTATIFDFENCQSSPCNKTIKVRTTDSSSSLYFDKVFSIEIKNVNEAPIALSDPYNLVYGNTLTELAPGILGNDSDPDGDPLSAELVTPPAHHKTFQLNPDGSFTYQPANGWTGEDSFTYIAKDEGGLSSITTEVVITVSDKTKPQVVWDAPAEDGDVIEIQTHRQLTLEATATDDIGVKRVRFYRWVPTPTPEDPQKGFYADIANLNGQPYAAVLDTRDLVRDWNQIFVKAYDASGNESGRTWIWVINKVPNQVFLPVLNR